MVTWRINNATSLGGEVAAQWQPDHVYSSGARCICRTNYGTTAARKRVYECTTGGTSGSSEPTWNYTNTGDTTDDNTAQWTCRSPHDGNWDNASPSISYVLSEAAVAAGDIVYVHESHYETYGMYALNPLHLKGSQTKNSPLRIFCVDKADDSLSTGAVIENFGYGIKLEYYGYAYGITLKTKSGAAVTLAEKSYWVLEGNGSSDLLYFNADDTYLVLGGYNNAPSKLKLLNGNMNFAYASCYIYFSGEDATLEWINGTLTAANGVRKLIYNGSGPRMVTFRNIDFSDLLEWQSILEFSAGENYRLFHVLFERCKLPDKFTDIVNDWPYWGCGYLKLHHCSDENKSFSLTEKTPFGSVIADDTVYASSGAEDGNDPFSWEIVGDENLPEGYNNQFALESPPIVKWCDTAGARTFTIEALIDYDTHLQNDEVWMELDYPANDDDGLGGRITDKCAVFGTPADKTSSTKSWTTTGIKPGNWSESWTRTLDSYDNQGDDINFRVVLPAAGIVASGSRCRIRIMGPTTWAQTYIDGCSIVERDGSTENGTTTPTRITFKGGHNSAVVSQNKFLYSDWIDFTIDETKDYLVHFALLTSPGNPFWANKNIGGTACYKKTTTDDDTLTQSPSGYSTSGYGVIICKLEVADASDIHKFKCSVNPTLGKKGPVTARICLAKPNIRIYVDPMITES